MNYQNVREAIFLSRPNRFIAHVMIDGMEETVHVINTGRCKELLVAGSTVYVDYKGSAKRSTAYDLIAVRRSDGKIVNIDSTAPNRMAAEWLSSGALGPVDQLRAEVTVEDSRYDFYAVIGGRKTLIEVKGCTLEREGIAFFPDAPTERGTKHVNGLNRHAAEGFRCILLIVIQMNGIRAFKPNRATDSAFADALQRASAAGVEIYAVESEVIPGYAAIRNFVPVEL